MLKKCFTLQCSVYIGGVRPVQRMRTGFLGSGLLTYQLMVPLYPVTIARLGAS